MCFIIFPSKLNPIPVYQTSPTRTELEFQNSISKILTFPVTDLTFIFTHPTCLHVPNAKTPFFLPPTQTNFPANSVSGIRTADEWMPMANIAKTGRMLLIYLSFAFIRRIRWYKTRESERIKREQCLLLLDPISCAPKCHDNLLEKFANFHARNAWEHRAAVFRETRFGAARVFSASIHQLYTSTALEHFNPV